MQAPIARRLPCNPLPSGLAYGLRLGSMRHALLLLALGVPMTAGALAQATSPDGDGVVEPEFVGVVFRLDAGKLIPLERQAAVNMRTKTSGFMSVHARSAWEFAGARSSVRFVKGTLEFVVRTQAQIDRDAMPHLRKLDSTKKTREMVIATAHATPFGVSSSATLNDGALPVTFKRYGNSSVKMSVAELPPGEYAIQAAPYPQAVFCFGVD